MEKKQNRIDDLERSETLTGVTATYVIIKIKAVNKAQCSQPYVSYALDCIYCHVSWAPDLSIQR